MTTSVKKTFKEVQSSYKEYGLYFAYTYHFWGMLHSSSAVVLGCAVFGSIHDDKWWFKGIIKPLYRVSRGLVDTKFWFFYRFVKKHRYNVVYTDLEPGYYDTDTVMLHSCFSLLVKYVEREQGGESKLAERIEELSDTSTWGQQSSGYNPPEMMESQASTEQIVLDLYRWWKYTKPADEERCSKLLEAAYSGKLETKEVIVNGVTMHEMIPDMSNPKIKEAHSVLKDKIENDEQVMLHKLIEIRRSLWT